MSETFLNEQLARLKTIPFAPSKADEVKAFIDEAKLILRRYARSEDHCQRIMDVVMERTTKGFPAPGLIAEVAAAVPEVATVQDALARCPECHGTGYAIVTREDGITGAKRCECYKKSEPRPVVAAVQERWNPSRDRDEDEAELAEAADKGVA